MTCRVSLERRTLASAIGRLALLVALFNLVAILPASAASFVAFGPQTFVRNTGAPVVRQATFTVLNPSAPHAIEIDNAGIASAIITLNGEEIFGPSDFNRNVTRLTKAVSLAASNVLSVELRSAPGSTLTIRIVGQDTDAPVIQPLITPGPNIYGWNNTNVSVAFTCTDPTSGIPIWPATPGRSRAAESGLTRSNLSSRRRSTRRQIRMDGTAPRSPSISRAPMERRALRRAPARRPSLATGRIRRSAAPRSTTPATWRPPPRASASTAFRPSFT